MNHRGWPVYRESTEDLDPDFWDVVDRIDDVPHEFLITECSEKIQIELHIPLEYAKKVKRLVMDVYKLDKNPIWSQHIEIG